MGFFLFPVLAFVLWEFPSMVLMATHKLLCAATGQSLQGQFLGIWAYRLIGMFTFWPVILVTAGVAVGTGAGAAVGQALLLIETVATIALLVWARISANGS